MASNYWINREKLKLRKNLKDATRTTKRVRRNMDKARLEIESEMAKMFSKYAKDNKMTYAEAIQMLTSDEFSEFKMDIVDYVSRIKASGSDELLLELNTLSAKARINRLESLLYQCNKILNEDYKFKTDEVRELMGSGVMKSFNHNVDSFGEFMGIRKALSYINPKVVSDIVNMPWSGKNYSSRLWTNKQKLMDKLEEQLTVALIQGKDLRKISKEVKDTFDVAKNVTERLINTEHAYACAQGDLKSYEEIGIKKYEYVATLDIRTSNICRSLDGKVFDLDEASPGLNFPPMHPHCRSTTIPYVTDIKDSSRIAKDSSGENIYVDGDMNYEQFHKKYVESDPEHSFKEKAWRNRHSDRKQFEKYKKVGVNVPESFDEYQYMKYNGSERDRHLRAVDYSRRMKLIENPELALPNVDTATIDNNKFEKYLFDGDNKDGLIKGKLIEKRLGYNIENYLDFKKEILNRAKNYPAINKGDNGFVTKYEQKIIMYNVSNEPTNLKIGWGVNGEKTHLVTIFIEEEKNGR